MPWCISRGSRTLFSLESASIGRLSKPRQTWFNPPLNILTHFGAALFSSALSSRYFPSTSSSRLTLSRLLCPCSFAPDTIVWVSWLALVDYPISPRVKSRVTPGKPRARDLAILFCCCWIFFHGLSIVVQSVTVVLCARRRWGIVSCVVIAHCDTRFARLCLDWTLPIVTG